MDTTARRAQSPQTNSAAIVAATSRGAGAPGSGRLQLLECARLVAILSIVWLHTPESPQLKASAEVGRFAVPFFTMASMFLAFGLAARRPEMNVASYFRSRAQRIYLLFLTWSLIYGAVRLVSTRALHRPRPQMGLLDWIWNGTAHHLWFLPFICLASTLGFAVGRLAPRLGRLYWPVMTACALASLAFALAHVPSSRAFAHAPAPASFRNWGETIVLSTDALPSVGLAIALSMIHARLPRAFFDRPLVSIVGVIMWIGCLALLLATERTTLLETLSGLGLMILSLRRREVPALSRLAAWGSLSLGIYVLHVLFLEGFQDVARKLGYQARPAVDVATFAFTLLACAATIALLNRAPRLRKLLL